MKLVFKTTEGRNDGPHHLILAALNHALSSQLNPIVESAKLSDQLRGKITADNYDPVFALFDDSNLVIEHEGDRIELDELPKLEKEVRLFLYYLGYNLNVVPPEVPDYMGLTRKAVYPVEALKYTGNNPTNIPETKRGYSFLLD